MARGSSSASRVELALSPPCSPSTRPVEPVGVELPPAHSARPPRPALQARVFEPEDEPGCHLGGSLGAHLHPVTLRMPEDAQESAYRRKRFTESYPLVVRPPRLPAFPPSRPRSSVGSFGHPSCLIRTAPLPTPTGYFAAPRPGLPILPPVRRPTPRSPSLHPCSRPRRHPSSGPVLLPLDCPQLRPRRRLPDDDAGLPRPYRRLRRGPRAASERAPVLGTERAA